MTAISGTGSGERGHSGNCENASCRGKSLYGTQKGLKICSLAKRNKREFCQ